MSREKEYGIMFARADEVARVWDVVPRDPQQIVKHLMKIDELLDDIETLVNHDCLFGDPKSRWLVKRQQKKLDIAVTDLAHLYYVPLARFTRAADREQFAHDAATVVHGVTPRDPDYDEQDEISGMRRMLREWKVLAQILCVISHDLRAAMRERPQSEAELQSIFETLLIASHMRFVREFPMTTRTLEQRRPDFYFPEIRAIVEFKCNNSARRQSAIADEVRADVSYCGDDLRVIFVIYDCGFIRDPQQYASNLGSYFTNALITIEIVKH